MDNSTTNEKDHHEKVVVVNDDDSDVIPMDLGLTDHINAECVESHNDVSLTSPDIVYEKVGVSANRKDIKIEDKFKDLRDREKFLLSDRLSKISSYKSISIDDLTSQLIREITEELAHLKFDRLKAIRLGKPSASITLARINSLKTFGDLLMKKLESNRNESVDLKSPRFRQILNLWMEFLYDSMVKVNIKEEDIDLIFGQMKSDMLNWEKKISDI